MRVEGWRGCTEKGRDAFTRAIGVGAIRAGHAGAVGGLKEAGVTGRADGLHA